MTTSTTIRAGAAITAASALVLAGLMSPASAASSTAKLKGAVTLGGQPVGFAKVQLYPLVLDRSNGDYEVGKRLKTDNTDSAGRYSFSGLTAKSATTNRYVVLVTDRASKGVKSYRTITAKKGKTLTQNVHLRPASALTGTVKRSDGRPATGLTVSLNPGQYNDQGESYEKLYPDWSTPVNADGTYALRGVPGGNYDEVIVSDGMHAQQCIDFVASTLADCHTDNASWQKQRVTLAPGERVLPSVVMTKSAPAVTTLKGKVTDTSRRSLKGIEVSVSPPGTGRSGTAVVTRSSGRFTLKDRLDPGTYVVRYHDPKGVYADQTSAGGTIQVTGGSTVRGLDVKLKSATKNRVSFTSGKGFLEVTFSLTRRVSGGRPSGTMTITSAGVSATAPVKKGKVTVRLMGRPAGAHEVTVVYSGTSNTAGFTRGFSPK